MPAVRFVLKFAQGQDPRLAEGEFLSASGEEFAPLNDWLKRHPPREVSPTFDVAPASAEQASTTERELGMDRFFNVVVDLGREEVEERLSELRRLPFLEEAYEEGTTEPARE